jgi:hypothetical protein
MDNYGQALCQRTATLIRYESVAVNKFDFGALAGDYGVDRAQTEIIDHIVLESDTGGIHENH